jgi:hypothetical protein
VRGPTWKGNAAAAAPKTACRSKSCCAIHVRLPRCPPRWRAQILEISHQNGIKRITTFISGMSNARKDVFMNTRLPKSLASSSLIPSVMLLLSLAWQATPLARAEEKTMRNIQLELTAETRGGCSSLLFGGTRAFEATPWQPRMHRSRPGPPRRTGITQSPARLMSRVMLGLRKTGSAQESDNRMNLWRHRILAQSRETLL